MASPLASPPVAARRRPLQLVEPETRFDRRLARILVHATDVFYEKGYEGASMRDLARASGMSLGGMYYYFGSKEKLLYLIQKHTFTTIMKLLREALAEATEPEERIRVFIRNHVGYFLANQKAMKVLSHEDDALKNGFGSEIAALKREYYRLCVGLLEDYKHEKTVEFSSRTAVLSLFGAMNWIYTWYKPRVDPGAEQLAREIADIFLQGIRHPRVGKSTGRKKSSVQ